jgi:hypothetical protein
MLGKLLVVEFELGQQSLKLALFGISKACSELSLEIRLLILSWWIPYAIGYLCKDAWFLDGCKYRVESVFVRVGVVDVKSSLYLCEPETRFVFPKWQASEASRGVMWWCDAATDVASHPPGLPVWLSSAWWPWVERLIILLMWFILSLTCGAEMRRQHNSKLDWLSSLYKLTVNNPSNIKKS